MIPVLIQVSGKFPILSLCEISLVSCVLIMICSVSFSTQTDMLEKTIPPGIFGTKATMVASLFIPTSPWILDGKQTLIVSVHQAFLNLFARFGWLNHLDILVFTPYFMPVSERINCSFCLSYLKNTYYLTNSMLMVDWARLLSQQCWWTIDAIRRLIQKSLLH